MDCQDRDCPSVALILLMYPAAAESASGTCCNGKKSRVALTKTVLAQAELLSAMWATA